MIPVPAIFLRVCFFSLVLLVLLEANNTQEGLIYLNNIRHSVGLVKFKSNTFLQNAATSHANYLIQNQSIGHYEEKGKYAYTGSTPSERVKKAGYPSAYVMENISTNTEGQVKSINNLFAAIYHRLVFLNFDKDEIGLGFASTHKKKSIKYTYVYNLASSSVSKLCYQSFAMQSGAYYMRDICKQKEKMIPQTEYSEAKAFMQRRSADIILYPYDKQTNIWPAFYNESPDPLPGYKVSGFPVSVQLNPAYYKNIQFKSFLLYDESTKESIQSKILQQKNDHNRILKKHEFVLMPLRRLEFDKEYTAVFEAKADGRSIKKQWSFRTKNFKETVYRINQKETVLTLKAGSSIILYIVPTTQADILSSYTARGNINVSFLDQNTFRVTLAEKGSLGKSTLYFGEKRQVSFIGN